jgi:hypothetical protein
MDIQNIDSNHLYNDIEYYNYINSYNKFKLNLHIFSKINFHKKQFKKCSFKDCNNIGSYNYINKFTKHFCKQHKLDSMINFNYKKCSFQDCYKFPIFNYYNQKNGIYCYDHRLLDMINVLSKRCKTPLCDLIVTNKYKGYCLYCFSNIFPDNSSFYKTKQHYVFEFVHNNFNHLSWIHDKKIYDGCSLRRPDLFLDLGYHIIIIETDENQHILYNTTCDNKRLMLLSKDVNHRPIIFIRFNPDTYIKDGVIIPSCWSTTPKKGLIKLINIYQWNYRLHILKNEINFWINPINISHKIIHVVKLFFDT